MVGDDNGPIKRDVREKTGAFAATAARERVARK